MYVSVVGRLCQCIGLLFVVSVFLSFFFSSLLMFLLMLFVSMSLFLLCVFLFLFLSCLFIAVCLLCPCTFELIPLVTGQADCYNKTFPVLLCGVGREWRERETQNKTPFRNVKVLVTGESGPRAAGWASSEASGPCALQAHRPRPAHLLHAPSADFHHHPSCPPTPPPPLSLSLSLNQ